MRLRPEEVTVTGARWGYNRFAGLGAFGATGPAMPTVRLGSKGPAVGELQQRLNMLAAGLKVDEIFGANTDRAVRKFQTVVMIPSDGIVGPRTWAELFAATATVRPPPSAPLPATTPAGQPIAPATPVASSGGGGGVPPSVVVEEATPATPFVPAASKFPTGAVAGLAIGAVAIGGLFFFTRRRRMPAPAMAGLTWKWRRGRKSRKR